MTYPPDGYSPDPLVAAAQRRLAARWPALLAEVRRLATQIDPLQADTSADYDTAKANQEWCHE